MATLSKFDTPFNECFLEIPPQLCLDLKAKIDAEFIELDGNTPTEIIKCDQESKVRVTFNFEGSSDLRRLICGKLCVCVAFESCGKGPEGKECKIIDLNLCDQLKYIVEIVFPKNYFCPAPPKKDDCGTVFCLCLTAIFLDNCKEPKPVGIGAFCKGPCIMVMP
ncbi:MAG: hypothetical protein MN733_23595 [Nitrososphaera sp.]|nr:hypothetical protein [Nitrososphaera sp.]